jgi:hypothetical protein
MLFFRRKMLKAQSAQLEGNCLRFRSKSDLAKSVRLIWAVYIAAHWGATIIFTTTTIDNEQYKIRYIVLWASKPCFKNINCFRAF